MPNKFHFAKFTKIIKVGAIIMRIDGCQYANLDTIDTIEYKYSHMSTGTVYMANCP